jgi:Prp8 binding protein
MLLLLPACTATAASGTVQYALPGHKGSVNEVVFHPKEPIVGSCSNDRTIFLGELADS